MATVLYFELQFPAKVGMTGVTGQIGLVGVFDFCDSFANFRAESFSGPEKESFGTFEAT